MEAKRSGSPLALVAQEEWVPAHPSSPPEISAVEPAAQRQDLWASSLDRFLAEKSDEGTSGETWLRRIRWHVMRTPSLLARAGVEGPLDPATLTLEQLRRLTASLPWERNTVAVYFAALRQFLRFVGNPLAEKRGAWRIPSGEATHRRWMTQEDLTKLLQASRGRESVLIALEGFNAFRRVEVIRLHVRDVDLREGRVRVRGKGRGGGKWRTIPLTQTSRQFLAPWIAGKSPTDRVLDGSSSSLDRMLREAAKRAGLATRVSNHDLRRTFGRIAYQSGMSLVDLKNFMGHASVDMTSHYIGVDENQMRDGLVRFDEKMAAALRALPEIELPVPKTSTPMVGRSAKASPQRATGRGPRGPLNVGPPLPPKATPSPGNKRG